MNAAVTELRDAEAEFRKEALPPGAPLGDLTGQSGRASSRHANGFMMGGCPADGSDVPKWR